YSATQLHLERIHRAVARSADARPRRRGQSEFPALNQYLGAEIPDGVHREPPAGHAYESEQRTARKLLTFILGFVFNRSDHLPETSVGFRENRLILRQLPECPLIHTSQHVGRRHFFYQFFPYPLRLTADLLRLGRNGGGVLCLILRQRAMP